MGLDGSRGLRELNAKTEILEALDEAIGELGAVSGVEVVDSEILPWFTPFEDEVGRGQHGSGDRYDGFLRSTTSLEAKEEASEVGVLLLGSSPRGLDESGLEPRVALSELRGSALAGALVVPGAEAGPGDEMTGGGKARHIETDLGDDSPGHGIADAGNRGQERDLDSKGLEKFSDSLLDEAHGCFDGVDLGEVELEQEAVVVTDLAGQGLDELLLGRLEAARATQGGQGWRIRRPGHDAAQDGPAAHAQDVREDARELDVRVFQGLLDPLRVTRRFTDELSAGPGQIPHLLYRDGRDEAPADQAVGQKVCEPDGVGNVGLAAREIPDLLGIGQDELHGRFQHVPDRLPVDARGFHGRVRHILSYQPVRKCQESFRRRGESPDFLPGLAPRLDPSAGYDRLLVNVEPGTTRKNDFQGSPLLRKPAWDPAYAKSRNRAPGL